MTLTAALTAVTTMRRPFRHRHGTLPTEREVPHDRIAVPDPDPLEWPASRLQAELIMQAFVSRLVR
jgi:hypothetical protein